MYLVISIQILTFAYGYKRIFSDENRKNNRIYKKKQMYHGTVVSFVQRCNDTTAGLGYLEVSVNYPKKWHGREGRIFKIDIYLS